MKKYLEQCFKMRGSHSLLPLNPKPKDMKQNYVDFNIVKFVEISIMTDM